MEFGERKVCKAGEDEVDPALSRYGSGREEGCDHSLRSTESGQANSPSDRSPVWERWPDSKKG